MEAFYAVLPNLKISLIILFIFKIAANDFLKVIHRLNS